MLVTQLAHSNEFLQEARDFVSESGGALEMSETILESLLAHGLQKSAWRKVHVKLTPGCFLEVDKHPLGRGVVYATLPPDAAVDLQEKQIMNLQRKPFWIISAKSVQQSESASTSTWKLALNVSPTVSRAY